jgi:predicted lipoprotein
MWRILSVIAALLPAPSFAGVTEVVDRHILPGHAAFAAAADQLARVADEDCSTDAVGPAWNAAFDAWMAVSHLRLGPSETAALSIAFWPDPRGATGRALGALMTGADPAALTADRYAGVSAAARGLLALETMLFDPPANNKDSDDFRCPVVRAIATDLARQAASLNLAWQDHAAMLLTAGAAGNVGYLTPDEALRALYTQVLTGLEFTADQRLGRPLGTFDRPRPTRAEAWRSGRPLRNVVLSLEALRDMVRLLADHPVPQTEAAFDRAFLAADIVGDPTFQDIGEPQARLEVEALRQRVLAIRDAIAAEIGTPLGIAAGFNAMDGD